MSLDLESRRAYNSRMWLLKFKTPKPLAFIYENKAWGFWF